MAEMCLHFICRFACLLNFIFKKRLPNVRILAILIYIITMILVKRQVIDCWLLNKVSNFKYQVLKSILKATDNPEAYIVVTPVQAVVVAIC